MTSKKSGSARGDNKVPFEMKVKKKRNARDDAGGRRMMESGVILSVLNKLRGYLIKKRRTIVRRLPLLVSETGG